MQGWQEIHQQRLSKMEVKKREIEERHRQELATKTKLTDRIIYHGLWQTRLENEENINSLPNLSTQHKALKIQHFFQKHVLKQRVSDKNFLLLNKEKCTRTVPTTVC